MKPRTLARETNGSNFGAYLEPQIHGLLVESGEPGAQLLQLIAEVVTLRSEYDIEAR